MAFPHRRSLLLALSPLALGPLVGSCSDSDGGIRDPGPVPQFTVPAALALPDTVLRIARGDLDGNGRDELVASVPGAVLVLELNTMGRFELARTLNVGGLPFALELARLDGDNRLDLVAVDRVSSELLVFRGRGNGDFHAPTRIPSGASAEDLLTADFDGDGDLDVAVLDVDQRLFENDGSGQFTELKSFGLAGVTCMAAAPLDATPGADLVFGGATLEAVLDPTAAAPTFVSSTPTEPLERLALADVTGDGVADAVGLATRVLVLRGLGAGQFTFWQGVETPFSTAGGELVVAQLDDVGPLTVIDPHEVLAAAPGGTSVAVLRNHGSGYLTTDARMFSGTPPGPIAVGSFDRNEGPDLVVALDGPNRVELFSGDGAGLLEGPRLAPRWIEGSAPGDLEAVDLSGNGELDLVHLEPAVGVGYLTTDPQGGVLSEAFGAALNTTDFDLTRLGAADLDGDGQVDLVVLMRPTTGGLPTIATIQSLGSLGMGAALQPPTYHQVSGAELTHFDVGDLDGDAIVDLVASRPATGEVQVLFGNGDTTLSLGPSYPAVAGAAGLALTHLNADAVLDLVVTGTGGTAVLIGRTDGSFDPPLVLDPTLRGGALVLADLNGDAFEDVVIGYSAPAGTGSGSAKGLACYYADGQGGLMPPTFVGHGIEASHLHFTRDLLRPGSRDVVVNDTDADLVVIFTAGDGTGLVPMSRWLELPAGFDAAGVATGDLDNDGYQDLISYHRDGLVLHTSTR